MQSGNGNWNVVSTGWGNGEWGVVVQWVYIVSFARWKSSGGLLHNNVTVFNIAEFFPAGTSGKEPACQCRRCKRCEFNPRVRKISWRMVWQPTPVFLPGKFHGWMQATVHGVTKSRTQLKWLNMHEHLNKIKMLNLILCTFTTIFLNYKLCCILLLFF